MCESAVYNALSKIDDKSVLFSLRQALKDDNDDLRANSAFALGIIGNPSAINSLKNALKDDNSSVTENAAWALDKMRMETK